MSLSPSLPPSLSLSLPPSLPLYVSVCVVCVWCMVGGMDGKRQVNVQTHIRAQTLPFCACTYQLVFIAIVKQDVSFFDKTRTGELTNRLASDTAVIQNGARKETAVV